MNNVVLNRIRQQTPQSVPVIFKVTAPETKLSPPLELPELEKMLMDSLQPAPTPVVATEPTAKLFNHLWDFVDWYVPNREKFTSGQQIALDTLIQARDMVNAGCNCKRAHREKAASDYFKTFWTNNQTNDMLPTVLKISGASKIIFGDWLTYPV